MPHVDRIKAEKIAINFLQQYHSTSTVESSILNGEIWIVTTRIGLIDKQIRKIMIGANRGEILGYTDGETSNYVIKKSQIYLSIEKSLLGIGPPAYDKVIQKLYEEYHCHLPDCFEYPDYLNKVLKELFGDNYKSIVESIKNNLKDIVDEKPIRDFLIAISK